MIRGLHRQVRLAGWRKVSTLGLALLVGLAILEGGTRLARVAPGIAPIVIDQEYASFEWSANRILRYVPRPGAAEINAYGLRDHDYPLEKPPGTLRIVVVGDSVGFGFCTEHESIALDATFPKLLERGLRDPPLPGFAAVEVINLSVSGYDTTQEVEFLRVKGLALRPDVVILAYCLNDALEHSLELFAFRQSEREGLVRPHPSPVPRAIITHSHLARTVWYELKRLEHAMEQRPSMDVDRRGIAFDRLLELEKREKFETLVVVFPFFRPDARYAFGKEHRYVYESAAERGFPVLDLLEAFEAEAHGDMSRFRGRCRPMHPDESGHRLAAREIERYVRRTYGRAR